MTKPKEENQKEEGVPLCEKCGCTLIEEEGEMVCPDCDGQIDWGGEDGLEDE